MVKRIYGINEKGEKVELNFRKFLVMTNNDSILEIDTDVQKHPENPDLALNICTGPVIEIPEQPGIFRATEGHRYFSVFPGANNLVFIKVKRRNNPP